MFNPFFTTKSEGKGTGLGLSIVKRIVGSHKGKIRVEDAKPMGTVISVDFPKASPSEA